VGVPRGTRVNLTTNGGGKVSALSHPDEAWNIPAGLSEEEISRRIDERPDLLTRFAAGDSLALAELFEVGTGFMVISVEVPTR
jgi:hypothetical protein